MPHILVINGPNLNMLGTREPAVYGAETYVDLKQRITNKAQSLGIAVTIYQSNHEGELVTTIQKAKDTADGIIINPAAYSHTSVAILDALQAVNLPVVEVHISNIHTREPFRHHSYVSQVAQAVLAGCGTMGYEYALEHIQNLTKETK